VTDDQQFRLIAQVAAIAIAGAFWPQISRTWRRLGYRDGPSDTSWRRGVRVIGMAFVVFVAVVFVGSTLDALYRAIFN
jgi:hypothetical protein